MKGALEHQRPMKGASEHQGPMKGVKKLEGPMKVISRPKKSKTRVFCGQKHCSETKTYLKYIGGILEKIYLRMSSELEGLPPTEKMLCQLLRMTTKAHVDTAIPVSALPVGIIGGDSYEDLLCIPPLWMEWLTENISGKCSKEMVRCILILGAPIKGYMELR